MKRRLPSVIGADSPDVAAERTLRFEAWQILLSEGSDDVPPGRVRELGLYGGAQGIWVDKARTGDLTPDGMGLAVSVLHTGRSYADDLSEDSLLYHYPATNRGPNRDDSEVAALKWAQRLAMPVFTITPGPTNGRRTVRLSWVEDHDDRGKVFLLTFGEAPEGAATPEPDDAPFFLTASPEQKRALRKVRQGQQQFAMKVFHRYGAACAVCGIDLAGLIDAAHLCAAGQSGSFDARNGLPLCALHHRAFDRGLWMIDPTTTILESRRQGPSLEELRITETSLSHLPALPHPAALEHVWRVRVGAD
jgi:putative restriction endonuclease